MKPYLYFFALLLLLSSTICNAQTPIVSALINKINSYPSLTYNQVEKQKSPFTDDISVLQIKSSVTKQPGKTGAALFFMDESRGFKVVYNGSVMITMDVNNKTYELKDHDITEPYHSPYHWAGFMKDQLKLSPNKTRLLADTAINHNTCYHLQYILSDTVNAREAYDICLDKATALPVYTKEYLKGVFGKGDAVVQGTLTMINEEVYSNYKINPTNFPKITEIKVPADYTVEKKTTPLQAGDKIPDFNLQNLQGQTVSNKDLRGSYVLMDFSFNACAACALSLPSLKNLNERYKDKNFRVITVNTSDTKESVSRFAKKNQIVYPVLLKGAALSKSFRVSGYPTFFLVDKQGNIAYTAVGYDNDFEKDMTEKIEKLIAEK